MKKILLSIMSIAVFAMLVGSATYSYFTDEEVSEDNTFLAGIIDFQLGLGACELAISFLEEDSYLGVADDTSGWSTGDSTKNLGVSEIDLVLGTAYALDGEGDGTFSHRSKRGLGCWGGGQNDEVDSVDDTEKIVIEFDQPQNVNQFEIRSLFNHDTEEFGEVADVDLFLDGSCVKEYDIIGIEKLNVAGNDGSVVVTIDPEILVDRMEFYVDSSKENSDRSEFALSKIKIAFVECYDEDEFNLQGAVWEMNDIKPGYETEGTLYFCEKANSNNGGTMEMSCTYQAFEDDDGVFESDSSNYNPGPESDTDQSTGTTPASTNMFASYMTIVEMTYYTDDGTGSQNLLPALDDVNGNLRTDLQDLASSSLTQTLSSNGADGDYFYMKIKLDETAGNDYQGDIFVLDMSFTLWQIGYTP